MKRHYPFIAAGVGLVLATVIGVFANLRTAEAAAGDARFVRPDYSIARPGAVIDLSRYASLSDTGRLAQMSASLDACHDALASAGVAYTMLPPMRGEGACGYKEAVIVKASLSDWKGPEALPMTCDLAAKLHLWERHVVIPAAEKYLGSPVVEIKAFGSFSCRKVAGMARLSEHSFAKAADISGFRLADGREITVLGDFRNKGAVGDFLREIHDRACDLFDVTLGPDYNADHANHFHVDVGGEHACR